MMYGCTDVWMYGCTMYGCMDVWMHVCMHVCMYILYDCMTA